MKAFRATYIPWNYNKGGLDESAKETVLVIEVSRLGYDHDYNPDFVFIHGDGRLDTGSLLCFSDCQWCE